MWIDPRRALSVLTSSLTLSLVVLLAIPSWAAEKARLRVDDYQIEAELEPHLHQITARAKVKFTALQDLSVAVFELHNDLHVTRVLDEKNQPLSAERENHELRRVVADVDNQPLGARRPIDVASRVCGLHRRKFQISDVIRETPEGFTRLVVSLADRSQTGCGHTLRFQLQIL